MKVVRGLFQIGLSVLLIVLALNGVRDSLYWFVFGAVSMNVFLFLTEEPKR